MSSVMIALWIMIGGRGGGNLGLGGCGGLAELSLSGWWPSFSEWLLVLLLVGMVSVERCHSLDSSLLCPIALEILCSDCNFKN